MINDYSEGFYNHLQDISKIHIRSKEKKPDHNVIYIPIEYGFRHPPPPLKESKIIFVDFVIYQEF
jgi:hypothetical protein